MRQHRYFQLPLARPGLLAPRARSGGPVFLTLALLLAGACSSGGQGQGASPRTSTTHRPTSEEVFSGVPDGDKAEAASSMATTASSATGPSRSPAGAKGPDLGATPSVEPSQSVDPKPGACPSPKTCGEFAILQGRGWRPDANGEVHIRYFINPRVPVGGTVSESDIIGAIHAAAATWQRANPSVKFEYQGTTDREAIQGDGYSVFFMGLNTFEYRDGDGYIVEADIFPIATLDEKARWAPCDERAGDGGCSGAGFFEIQNTLTHEIGHALGLDHVGNGDDQFENLTMSPGQESYYRSRWRNTLGLGDILGVRHMYPCPGCPFPALVEP